MLMFRFYWFFIIALFCLPLRANTSEIDQTRLMLSPQAQISLITCSPTDDATFTLYGHTALRVYDPVGKIDWIYNYGIFDFSAPNFTFRFAKGETDYILGGSTFDTFLMDYTLRGSEIYEQVLNLQPEEKEALFQALEWNRKPENRTYRYNYFFDNCATRPLMMIENNIKGIIKFAPESTLSKPLYPSFREVINECTRDHPWQTFGCDLVLGLPTDRRMTQRETFFIPEYLKNDFNKAEIVREGIAEPLVIQTNILAQENREPLKPLFITAPITCFTLLFFLIMALTYFEWQRRKYYRLVDVVLFFCAGIAGCILFFLSFISVHPCIFPNISLLWLHPLHLTGIIFFAVKKWKKIAYWYHLINFAVVIIMSVGWFFIPQHFNIAFLPLILSLSLRSGWALLRKNNLTG